MGYTAQRSITIDHTKCGSSDSVNLPVLVSGVYAYLATIANGGAVTSNSGFDIVFTSDSAGLNFLNWEVESYDPVTGTVNIWIQIPSVSHTVDTVFYIWYGNAAVTTLQSAPGSVWYDATAGARYNAVYHLGGNPPSFADSTFNGNTQIGSGVTAVTGQIDGAAAFNGSSNYRVTADPFFDINSTAVSMEAWVKSATLTTQTYGQIICCDPVHANFDLYVEGGSIKMRGGNSLILAVAAPTNNAWHHIVGTIDAAGDAVIYIDGVSAGTATILGPADSPNFLEVGRYGAAGFSPPGGYFAGDIDEVRVSGNVYSASWILTEYNNQSSPSTFYTVGSAVVPPPGPTRPTYTWPTRIQNQATSGINDGTYSQIPLTVQLPQWVNVGDLIVVFGAADFPGSVSWTIADNLGNTYTESEFDDNSGGTGDSLTPMFWSVATTAGICYITVSGSMDQLMLAAAVYGSNAPPLSQGCSAAGFWPPTDLLKGISLQPVPTADSLVVSSIYTPAGSSVSFASDTGDTLVQTSPLEVPQDNVHHILAQFERIVSAGGTNPTNLRITSGQNAGNGTAAVFSYPVTRPGGLATQYACRPGLGGAVFFAGQPYVSTSLEYIPAIGSLLVIGVATGGAGLTMAVTDTYGNVYTQKALYDGTNGGIGTLQVSIFTAIVVHVPAGVEAFKVTATFTGTSGQLNHPSSIFAAEYAALGTIGAITGYTCASASGGGANLIKTASATVSGPHTLQVAVLVGSSFISSPFPMTITPSAGLSIQSQLVEPQSCAQMSGFANIGQLGLGALMDRFISTPGAYDAEAIINTGGAIVMITVPFTPSSAPTLACPLDPPAAIVGTFYSATLQFSGGVPPYTFSLLSGPSWLSIDSSGVVSGTPTAPGTFGYVAELVDSVGQTLATDSCPIVVSNVAPPFCIVPPVPVGESTAVAYTEPTELEGS